MGTAPVHGRIHSRGKAGGAGRRACSQGARCHVGRHQRRGARRVDAQRRTLRAQSQPCEALSTRTTGAFCSGPAVEPPPVRIQTESAQLEFLAATWTTRCSGLTPHNKDLATDMGELRLDGRLEENVLAVEAARGRGPALRP